MMEVFAGYGAHCDYEMGRVVDAVKQLPDADNTLIIYIAGDNGASAEGGLEGSLCENLFFNGFSEKWQDNIKAIDELGGPKHFNHFPSAWAHAMNTPFQWTKQVASHFGGTRNPMIISWPARIKDKGGLRRSVPAHDRYRADDLRSLRRSPRHGSERRPAEADRGRQLRCHLRDDGSRRATQDTVLRARLQPRALSRRLDGLVAVLRSVGSEPRRLRPRQGAVGALQDRRGFLAGERPRARNIPRSCASFRISGGSRPRSTTCCRSIGVARDRMNAEAMGRPSLIRGRTKMTYYPGTIGLARRALAADVQQVLDDHRRNRRPRRQGGGHDRHPRRPRGWLRPLPCAMGSRPSSTTSSLSIDPRSPRRTALPKGKTTLVVDFAYDGGGMGKGGDITMTANGKKIAEGRLETHHSRSVLAWQKAWTSAWMSARRSTSPTSYRLNLLEK